MRDSRPNSHDRRRFSSRSISPESFREPSRKDGDRMSPRNSDRFPSHHHKPPRDSSAGSDKGESRRDRGDRSYSHQKDDSEDRYRRHHRHHRDHRDHREYRDDRGDSPGRRRSRSPVSDRRGRYSSPKRRSRSRSPRLNPVRSRGPLPSQRDAFTSTEVKKAGGSPAPEKQKPNFANTGRLAAESNTVSVNGGSVVLKYHEPPEGRKPPAKDDWRLYVFKGSNLLEVIPLGERSCWLIGREQLVVDFPIEHPSCSKQHAAIQFRYVEKKNEFGDRQGRVRPYLIDLESANGSTVNGERVPASRYVELREKDVLRFGLSSREYVIIRPPPE
jgi:smad nuclear-interacting protein 1